MNREKLKELGLTDEQIDSVMTMNGDDINREKNGVEKLNNDIAEKDKKLNEMTEKLNGFSDYDAIKTERDGLKAEKDERLFGDRFNTVLGTNKPKNQFTRDGLIKAFRDEAAKPENKDKKDDEIFSALVKGHEAEYFDGKVTVEMAPHGNGGGNPATDYKSKYDIRVLGS